jgi:hypothetical protein
MNLTSLEWAISTLALPLLFVGGTWMIVVWALCHPSDNGPLLRALVRKNSRGARQRGGEVRDLLPERVRPHKPTSAGRN